MADAVEFTKIIKKTALEAMESTKPVNVCFGQVISVSPLQINVEQKMVLGKAQLILTRNVTDYKTLVTVQWEAEKEKTNHTHKIEGTDSEGNSIDLISKQQSAKHTHEIVGEKEITIHNALEVGDEVILIRQQEGQKYVVIDRIGVL